MYTRRRSGYAFQLFVYLCLPVLILLSACGGSDSSSSASINDVRVTVTPLRNPQFGTVYGAEARDETSGKLLAVGKQVAMEGDELIIEETQYSLDGDLIFRGKLYYSQDNDLIKTERIEGQRKWNVFRNWISEH